MSSRTIWPAMPFRFKRAATDPEWLHFFYAGPRFGTSRSIGIGWDIGALLVRFSELDENLPCPPYSSQNEGSFIKLEPRRRFSPTVGHCMRAVATFDFLLERWGYREIAFEFGVGRDDSSFEGTFALGHGMAPLGTASS